ncbi:uncharacterized protein LOC123308507 isoform X1 [Coccinella septempunctata]|uniref:uncharacterized protein LOC123308507 isoform X1 n=1 Tax=Coccinella septempunctata TaxID=41139 RepID=UPI001D07DFEB|nr:uncharacterized protein LOC123308507 isoform X1 [Coccinella septempunctata]
MSPTISDRQKQFIDEIAKSEGFEHYNLELDQGSLKGDNYFGIITVVTIRQTLTKNELHLILKSALQGEELRKKVPVHQVYERENFFYGVILRELSDLQREHKVKDVFDGTARFYGGLNDINEECLVLENLKTKGFKLWDRKRPMDSHHVGAVMAQYGKFHALSYALKKLKPGVFSKLTENYRNVLNENMSKTEMGDSMVNAMDRALKAVRGNDAAVAGLKRFMETANVFFNQTLKTRDKYSVIQHGDNWCNNIMFKYQDTKCQKPSKVYFLDWQLSGYGSPIQDLSYFFYSCSSKLVLDTHNSYLKIYYESLSAMLRQFNINPDEIMTFRELQLQWMVYAKYGMYMALLILKIMLSEQDEAGDLRDYTKKDQNVLSLFDGDITNTEEYNKRVSIVISHMVKNRFI